MRTAIFPPGSAIIFTLASLTLLLRSPSASSFLSNTDHGYQLALGMTFAKGTIPGFDTITQYGPLVSVFSGFAWFITGSIIGEVFICAFGYAAAIAVCFVILRYGAGVRVALIGCITLLVLLARFYKWYYWLIPLLGVMLAGRFRLRALSNRPINGFLVLWGLFIGVASLFRVDLGVEAAAFGMLIVLSVHNETTAGLAPGAIFSLGRTASHQVGLLVISGCLLPALYLSLLLVFRGPDRLVDFIRGTQDGLADSVEAYGITPFAFSRSSIFGSSNALALLQLLLPLFYLVGLWMANTQKRSNYADRSFTLLAISLTGLGVLPQALHRADSQHLLQVLPPFILLIGLLPKATQTLTSKIWLRRAIWAGMGLASIGLVGLVPAGEIDLDRFWSDPVQRWRELAGLPNSLADDPAANIAIAIRHLTPTHARIFILMDMTPSPLLFFAERRQPGLFPVYEPGMFNSHYWKDRNCAALHEEPPDYIVARRVSGGLPGPLCQPLIDAWREKYRRILFESPQYQLLAPVDRDESGLPFCRSGMSLEAVKASNTPTSKWRYNVVPGRVICAKSTGICAPLGLNRSDSKYVVASEFVRGLDQFNPTAHPPND